MSWKEVFRELSDMEGIVQRMEEEEVEQEDMVEVVREDQEKPDLKSKLMREIMDFNKKTQLRNVNEGEVQSEDDANDGVETINISPEEPRDGAHSGTHFNFDFKPGMSLMEESRERLVRRGSSSLSLLLSSLSSS